MFESCGSDWRSAQAYTVTALARTCSSPRRREPERVALQASRADSRRGCDRDVHPLNGDPIGAGRGKSGNEFVRSFNHEMTIERDSRDLARRNNDRRPDCDVGHEVAIREVHVKNGSSDLQAASACAPRQAKSAERIEGASPS